MEQAYSFEWGVLDLQTERGQKAVLLETGGGAADTQKLMITSGWLS